MAWRNPSPTAVDDVNYTTDKNILNHFNIPITFRRFTDSIHVNSSGIKKCINSLKNSLNMKEATISGKCVRIQVDTSLIWYCSTLLEMANAVKNATVVVIAAYCKYQESQCCEIKKHKSNTRRRHTRIYIVHVNTRGSDVEQRSCTERTHVTSDPDYKAVVAVIRLLDD